ncbi:MAG: GNAT family N-acetyltransferase [Bacteroidota bacterium]
MSNKEQYRHFCRKQKDIPLFSQAWHLDAVIVDGWWDVALVKKGGQIAGSLPYYLKKSGPFQTISLPYLTKMMGPYLLPQYRHSKHEYSILKALIDQLPEVAFFSQNMHYDLKNWLPFYWKGYQQSTYYSFVIDPLDDLDRVFGNFCSDYRNNKIKKAKNLVEIQTDRSLDDFYRLKKMSFERQGLNFRLSFDYLQRYDALVAQRGARTIFYAVDAKDQVHAAVYLVWDGRSAYYHMAGHDPNLRGSGAGILLVWEAIRYTKEKLGLQVFDFEGSMIPSIEKVRRNFGAQAQAYFNIWKYHSKTFQALQQVKNWVKSRD